MGQATFGHLQLADRGDDMAKGPRPRPFQDEGKASGVEDHIPMTAAVIAAYSNAGILSKLGDTKDLGETICRLLDSDGLAWNLHNCFYTIDCVSNSIYASLDLVDICTGKR